MTIGISMQTATTPNIWNTILSLSYLFSSAKSTVLELIESSLANFVIFAISVNFYFVGFFLI